MVVANFAIQSKLALSECSRHPAAYQVSRDGCTLCGTLLREHRSKKQRNAMEPLQCYNCRRQTTSANCFLCAKKVRQNPNECHRDADGHAICYVCYRKRFAHPICFLCAKTIRGYPDKCNKNADGHAICSLCRRMDADSLLCFLCFREMRGNQDDCHKNADGHAICDLCNQKGNDPPVCFMCTKKVRVSSEKWKRDENGRIICSTCQRKTRPPCTSCGKTLRGELAGSTVCRTCVRKHPCKCPHCGRNVRLTLEAKQKAAHDASDANQLCATCSRRVAAATCLVCGCTFYAPKTHGGIDVCNACTPDSIQNTGSSRRNAPANDDAEAPEQLRDPCGPALDILSPQASFGLPMASYDVRPSLLLPFHCRFCHWQPDCSSAVAVEEQARSNNS